MRFNPSPRRFILTASALALLSQGASAEILDQYTFGDTWPSVFTPTTVHPGIVATPITAGAGVTLDPSFQEASPLPTPWLRINPKAGNLTPEAAVTADASFNFTISVLPGFDLSLTSLAFDFTRGGGGTPRGYALQTSADNFGSIVSTADAPTARPNLTNVVVDLSGAAYQDLSTITFKMFSYSPGGGSSVDYDNITVNGTAIFDGYTWQGSSSSWDTTSANWTGPGTTYVDGTVNSNAFFSDAATETSVNVAAGGLNPNLVTIANSFAKDYIYSGGKLTVATSLFKAGEGAAIFNNEVSAGTFTVDQGMVEITSTGSLTSPTTKVSRTGNLFVGGAFSTTDLTVDGSFSLNETDATVSTLSGAATGLVGINDSDLEVTGTSTFAGSIGGSGSLLKSTGGTLTLSGANSYGGGTTITGGALQLNHASAAGFGPVVVKTGGILSLGAGITTPVTLDGGTLGMTANVTVPANVLVSSDSTIKTFNPISGEGPAELIVTGMLEGSGDLELISLNGDNPDGGRALRLRGPSSTGENAYSGTITVNPSFKFEILTSVDAGSPIGTGNLRMAGGTTTGNALGTYSLVNVRNNFAGDTTFGNDVEVTGVGSTYFNMLSDNSVAPVGSVVNFGKLIIGDAQAIAAVATASPAYTLAFSSVELTGGNATFTPRPVGNTSFVSTQNISLGAISERTVGSGITMNGAATLTLTGNNTYTGPTFVNSGILEVTGSISGSTVDLSGGTLRGSGTTGPVNVNGGTLAPGSGVGSLSTGAVAFQAGVFALEIGGSTVGSYDQLKVTGGLAFNAPITLTLDFSTFDPADGDSFVLVDNDLADPIVFADETSGLYYDFALLSEGSSFTVTSGAFTQEFTITYEGGTNANDIVLTAVPEPSAMVALLGGVAMLAGFRRRR